MAESMKLQVLKCPNCAKIITAFSAFKTTVTCPRCSAVMKNPMFTEKEEVLPERFIPFTTKVSDFEKSMVDTLIGQDYVPVNIFEAINTDDVFRAYLPMYLYEGSYLASWSCESSYEDQRVDISSKSIKTKNVKKWRPQNGNASGNFAFLCLANEGDEHVPDELRNFTYQFPYDVMMSKPFARDSVGEEFTVLRNADAALVWQKHGKDLVDETARKAALDQIGNQEIRSFRASSSFNLTTKGEFVLAPFWFVYYSYNNQRYNFMMDGTGQRYSYTYPVNQEEVDFVKGKERIKSIVKWLWPLSIVMWYLFSFSFAASFIIIWLIAKIVVNKVMDKQIQDHLDNSRELRRQGAARIS